MKEHLNSCRFGFIITVFPQNLHRRGEGWGCNQSVNHTNSRRAQALLPTALSHPFVPSSNRIHPFPHPTYSSIRSFPRASEGVTGPPDGHVWCGADARASRSGLCWEPPTRRGAEPEPTQGWKCSGSAAPASAPWTRRSSARSAYWTTPRSPAASR